MDGDMICANCYSYAAEDRQCRIGRPQMHTIMTPVGPQLITTWPAVQKHQWCMEFLNREVQITVNGSQRPGASEPVEKDPASEPRHIIPGNGLVV